MDKIEFFFYWWVFFPFFLVSLIIFYLLSQKQKRVNNLMNQFENIQQSISIQNSQPQSVKLIKDAQNGTAFQTQSNSEQSEKLSNHSIIIVSNAPNDLETDLFNGVEANKLIDIFSVIGTDLTVVPRSNYCEINIKNGCYNQNQNGALAQIDPLQDKKERVKQSKNKITDKVKIPAFQEIEPFGKYISIDDSVSQISSQKLSLGEDQLQQFFSKTEPKPNPFQKKPETSSIQNNFNSIKPSYLNIQPSHAKKFSIFHSNTLTTNSNTDCNLSKKYQNCKILLIKQIQKNKELSQKLIYTNKENQQLRSLICEVMGEKVDRVQNESRKSLKKKMNRLTTQKTQKAQSQQQFPLQIAGGQLQNSLTIKKSSQLFHNKFSQKIIKTQGGAVLKQNEKKVSKKIPKQSIGRKKTVEQLSKKVSKFELMLNQIMKKKRFSRSQLSHGKQNYPYSVSKGTAALNYGKLNTEFESSQSQLKKKVSKTKKKRIQTEAREKSGL